MSRRKLPKEKKKETRLCYRAEQAQVVRKVNDAIHRIIHYPLGSISATLSCLVCVPPSGEERGLLSRTRCWWSSLTIHWIAIYPALRVIQPVNNWDKAVLRSTMLNEVNKRGPQDRAWSALQNWIKSCAPRSSTANLIALSAGCWFLSHGSIV